MGAADLVPGVSGGTVAFITGIYERLLDAISALSSAPLLRDALKFRIGSAWRRADGGFLAALLAGILSAALLLGNLLHYLLVMHAHLLLAFFGGLVLASAASVACKIRTPAPPHLAAAALGAAAALWIVAGLPAQDIQPSPHALFLGGAAAICAMILPGISGSYVLLVVGLYGHVIDALRTLDFLSLGAFAAGCAAGLLLFARALSHLLKRMHDSMLAFLIGVMLGAMPKLWPWKEQAEGTKTLLQPNVWPAAFNGDPQVLAALLAAAGGAALVWAAHIAVRRSSSH